MVDWFQQAFGIAPARSHTIWYGPTTGDEVHCRLILDDIPFASQGGIEAEDALRNTTEDLLGAVECEWDSVEVGWDGTYIYRKDDRIVGRFRMYREELN